MSFAARVGQAVSLVGRDVKCSSLQLGHIIIETRTRTYLPSEVRTRAETLLRRVLLGHDVRNAFCQLVLS